MLSWELKNKCANFIEHWRLYMFVSAYPYTKKKDLENIAKLNTIPFCGSGVNHVVTDFAGKL